MRVELFDHLLLLAAITCAATLVKLLRRSDGIGRGYAIVVGLELLLTMFAMGSDRFVGFIALAMVTLTVALPWALEHGSRVAFARGRLAWVGRLSSLRASVMPGSGLARQLPIIEGLALVDKQGVDAALAHFRRLADEADDPAELAMIHEQIVSMLFHGQRWDEGIAHYERRFHPGYAALRPGLALGLLRAYGEAGRLETAAGLLRELEDGPVGADPNTAELLGQARLTFLAYAGAVEPIDALVRERQFVELGLSAATAELFKGIAQARAGEPREAVETLSKVEDLAGPRDRRVLEAARAVLERVGQVVRGAAPEPTGSMEPVEQGIELGPELRSYVELVAARLQQFLLGAPPIRRHERPWVTRVVMVSLSLVYGVHLLRGGGGLGLLELGALSEDLLHAGGWGRQTGSWARVFTSAWIHIDLVALLFDVYAIWLAGQIVERMLGPARMAMVSVVAALAGVAASAMAVPLLWAAGLDSLAVIAPTGGNLMAVGAIVAALWLLLPSRTPALTPRSRRNLVVTLSLLLLANLLSSWPSLLGVGAAGLAPVALLTTIVFSTVFALAIPIEQPRWLGLALGSSVAAVMVASVVAAVVVLREDPEAFLIDHRAQVCELDGVLVHTPISMSPISVETELGTPLPIVDGLVDGLELRDGSVVQLAVVRGKGEGVEAVGDEGSGAAEMPSPALFAVVESLEHEVSVTAAGALPEPFAELLADQPPERWRAFDLWRNGERIGRVIERDLAGSGEVEGATLVLIASPADATEHAAAIYAAILRDATLALDSDGRSRRTRCTVS